jgi:alkylated DNA nucleotide flippase Atl1
MAPLPKKIRKALAITLSEGELAAIERHTADEELAWIEDEVTNNKFDDYDVHILTLVRGVRDLLALGQTDAAVLVAFHLGGVLADQEAHSHLFWHRGERAVRASQNSVEATWGSWQQRQARKAERIILFEQERPKFTSDQEAYEAVAKQCGVSWRTIRRTVTGH